MEIQSLTGTSKKKKKIWTENVVHATAGKTQYVADKSRPLYLSQATKT